MSNCTWTCPPDCEGEHHPLLVSLFRVKDSESLSQFTGTLKNFQVTGFNLEMNIPDPNPAFRHLIIHWASVLGKVDVVKALLKPPFSMDADLQSDSNETALHRSLIHWNCKDIPLDHALPVVEQLKSCIESSNAAMQTPLHICALNLTKCTKQHIPYWTDIMNKMVSCLCDDSLLPVLNSQDANGDSIIHILSAREDLVEIIQSLLACGANFNIVNLKKEKPIDIAWKFSMTIYNLYRIITTEIGFNEFYASNTRSTRAKNGLSKVKKDYKKFFDESAELSDEDDYITPKRKTSGQKKCNVENQNGLDMSYESGSKKRKAKTKLESDLPSVVDLLDEEIRLENEISITMKSILEMLPQDVANEITFE